MKWNTKLWEPWFIENSKVPVWLSYVAPINIGAISFGLWVWSRGEMNKTLRRHETIYFQQQLEMLFVFQWIAYGAFWLFNLAKYRDGAVAYREIPFEREAYANEKKFTYLEKRKRFAWTTYIRSKSE